jgi:DNA-binding HxlR family transcriptional regulator
MFLLILEVKEKVLKEDSNNVVTSRLIPMTDIEETIKFLLSKEKERKVLEALNTGRKSFIKLRKAAGLKYNEELSRALKNLGRYVLYDHVYRKGENKAYSYYEINPMGREALNITREIEAHIRRIKEEREVPA